MLAEIRLALGRLREAIETVEQCLQFVRDQGEPVPLDTADLHRELGELGILNRETGRRPRNTCEAAKNWARKRSCLFGATNGVLLSGY